MLCLEGEPKRWDERKVVISSVVGESDFGTVEKHVQVAPEPPLYLGYEKTHFKAQRVCMILGSCCSQSVSQHGPIAVRI